MSPRTAGGQVQEGDNQWKQSKICFVTAENIPDAREVLGFEVHTLLIDEWAEVELEIWRFYVWLSAQPTVGRRRRPTNISANPGREHAWRCWRRSPKVEMDLRLENSSRLQKRLRLETSSGRRTGSERSISKPAVPRDNW
jgi:hypothetical protein